MPYFDNRTRRQKWLDRAAGVLGLIVFTALLMLGGKLATTNEEPFQDPLAWADNVR